MTPALDLALWIRANYRRPGPLTHLKLQKLAFYCYGAALAHRPAVLGEIPFEAWAHGPVSREIWHEYRDYRDAPIEPPSETAEVPRYTRATETVLSDVLAVYGPISAWGLRQESHLERPWIEAFQTPSRAIPSEALRQHFLQKYCAGRVTYPAHLGDIGSFALDGIPVRPFASLHELALVLTRAT